MSFESLFQTGAGAGSYLPMANFSSPALSLALQQTEGQRDRRALMPLAADGLQPSFEEKDNVDSHSGSEHLDADGISADEHEPAGHKRKRKKRYNRHTPQQIQELETLFKECPHPDEKQRADLSRRLSLEPRQVKFWFQNRRTQMKMQLERHENALLRAENERLRSENMSIREGMRNPICGTCGGSAVLSEVSMEEQHLRMENARLKDELARVCALAGKFLGKPVSPVTPLPLPLPSSSLGLSVGANSFASLDATAAAGVVPPMNDFTSCMSSQLGTVITPSRTAALPSVVPSVDGSIQRSMLLELALSSMDELVKMTQVEEPLWFPVLDDGYGGKYTLNRDEYVRTFSPCIGGKLVGFTSAASRETSVVIISSLALIETLMDATRWADMFPCIVAKADTTEVLASGLDGSRNGTLQLMHAELQVLSPLVPMVEVSFLRFCKQLAEGAWAVVDVSADSVSPAPVAVDGKCRRLPSGCLVQDLPNGFCKVTWVEHAEYDESAVHHLYRPPLRSGLALGATRWLATLQRQCECIAILMSNSVPVADNAMITASGRRSMLKLARRMTDNFCAGMCASSTHKWSKLVEAGNIGADVRVMTRQSVTEPGEPPGVVLSAATSVWLPVEPMRIFDFLRDERLRGEWDILSNGGPMQEMAHIAKGQHHGNAVSLLRASTVNTGQNSMLILQETCTDASGSMVVYAPVDVPAMHIVMSGGDSTYVALLPSGFAILPDRPRSCGGHKLGGSLLTVAFQILVNSQPTAKLTVESVETVNNLISCTIMKIKAALNCPTTT